MKNTDPTRVNIFWDWFLTWTWSRIHISMYADPKKFPQRQYWHEHKLKQQFSTPKPKISGKPQNFKTVSKSQNVWGFKYKSVFSARAVNQNLKFTNWDLDKTIISDQRNHFIDSNSFYGVSLANRLSVGVSMILKNFKFLLFTIGFVKRTIFSTNHIIE